MKIVEANTQDKAPRRGGVFGRFRRDRRGATAIEFGLLALPFSLLIFAIMEVCISFAGEELLSNAADKVARQMRTGQIKAADMTEAKLKQMICTDVQSLVAAGCPDLVVDLREFPTFESAAAVTIKFTSDNDIDTTGFAVAPGKSMSKNMLRVFYRWPIITDFMSARMSNLKGGKILHFATVTWQNEPFDD